MKKIHKDCLANAYNTIVRILDWESQEHTQHIKDIQFHKATADVEVDVCVALTVQAANIRALEQIATLLADVAGLPRYAPDPSPDPEDISDDS